jgi:DNA-nicking Smr family endonuclease
MSNGSFTLLRDEPERLEGIAPGIDRAHLRRLRRGEVRVDEEVDLHGLDRREAGSAVREALKRAIAGGGRCVRVIHGRGGHSPDGRPVLRSSLVGWLSEAAHASQVMAFASGLRERGGATYVLLRRRR